MSADAIAVFHPKDLDKLKPFLDLGDDVEESDGLYAEALDDGTMLVHTFQPFEIFEQNPGEARVWLSQFGAALPDVHDDPRGLLFFPDTHEPDAMTYDAVVAEMADKGIFIATSLVDDDHEPAIDFEALQSLAGQLLGGEQGGGSSFEVAKLFEDMQQQLASALGVQHILQGNESPVLEHEFEPDETDPKKT